MRKLVAGLVLLAGSMVAGAGVAGAQEAACPESPQVCPPPEVRPEEPGDAVVPRDEVVVPREVEVAGALPVTGTDTAVLVGAGVVLVAGGSALVLRSKRVQTAEA